MVVENCTSTCKKVNINRDLTPFTKINSKWITDLNVKCRTLKLIINSTGEILDDLEYGNNFLDLTSKVQSIKEILYTLNFIKMKAFFSAQLVEPRY